MEKQKHIFTTKTAVRILKTKKTAVNEMLKGLVKKGWLIRIKRGLYLIIPLEAGPESKYTEHNFIIASHLVAPYYIGFWGALNFHGFTEQVPNTVFIATTKTLRNRKIFGTNYKFVKIKQKKFFGFKKYFIANKPVCISNKEKTIVDCFDRPELCGGTSEAIKPLLTKEEIDYKKLIVYAEKTGGACLKRIGFVLEKLKLADASKLLKKVKSGYVYLDILAPKKGKYNSKWNIVENIDLKKLKKEVLA